MAVDIAPGNAPPATGPPLEVRDETIGLLGKEMSPAQVEQYVNPLIQQRLKMLIGYGWEVGGATDARTLWRAGRLACREHASFWQDAETYDLTSVTIRIKRTSTA